jgi:hypothetical protein
MSGQSLANTWLFTRNNEPDGIENATHNTLQQKAGHQSGKCPGFSPDELRVAFSIPSGSLFLVNHLVFKIYTLRFLFR